MQDVSDRLDAALSEHIEAAQSRFRIEVRDLVRRHCGPLGGEGVLAAADTLNAAAAPIIAVRLRAKYEEALVETLTDCVQGAIR